MHQQRKHRDGHVGTPDPKPRMSIPERLAAMSTRAGECRIWTAAINNKGYGRIGICINGRRRMHYAHRVAYEAHVGPIPQGMFVLHSCDTPACIEPTHLRTGTQLDNGRDVRDRRRHPQHLPPNVVAAIYAHADRGMGPTAIANTLGIPYGTVSARLSKRRRDMQS